MIKTVLAAVLVLLCGAASAEPRHQAAPICDNKDVMRPCAYQPNFLAGVKSIKIRMHRVRNSTSTSEVIGGRPAGCPSAYCGCSASLKVFGRIIPQLNLAENWRRFAPTSPAAGMVAWRKHHVFVILAVNADGTVTAHDGNSGGHLTRIHTVSLRGYHVVNPHANAS